MATDLKPETENALMRAVQLAYNNNAKLHVAHILPTANNPNFEGLVEEKSSARHNDIIELIKKHPNGDDIKCDVLILYAGRVQDQIDKTAHDLNADIVILGADRSSANGPDFLRSKAEHLVWEGSYPVLVAVQDVTGPYKNTLLVGREHSAGLIDLLFKNRRQKFKQKITNRIHRMLTSVNFITDTDKYTFIEKTADLDLLSEIKSKHYDLAVIRVEQLDWSQPDFGKDIHQIILSEPCDILLMKR